MHDYSSVAFFFKLEQSNQINDLINISFVNNWLQKFNYRCLLHMNQHFGF